ncbi:MAG TPA: restriction endonuclease subunit R [Cyanobacteria bacterium UBA8553]|nr:restriction endonuclease subunit R [Cyanobacteria bacterium UBA8553]HAJ63135.1 restriction endonuclease subunit R [Cyanobacteria bacterium UBA8543]
MTTLNAEKLTLKDVHRLLGFQKQPMGEYSTLLSLEPLTTYEHQELLQIAHDFDNYLSAEKVLEGLVKVLTTFPLLRLAGFYRFPVELSLEEGIARIVIEDEDTFITGRFDILAINKTALAGSQPFWILLIESKNSSVDLSAGLPQLLAYAYTSLEYQTSVWGLATNGLNYQFVYLTQGTTPMYQLMPPLHLFETERANQLLQVLKALCKLQISVSPDSAVA